MKKAVKWLKILAVIYFLGGVALYFLQDRILFHPVSLKKDHQYNFPGRHNEVNIPLSQSVNLNIIQFLPKDSVVNGVVLYFHGNKKNISRYAEYAHYFTDLSYELWMIDYPGYGKSTGKFTEQILYDWALQMYQFARARFTPDSIIIYGKSMGTGIATQLASIRDCNRLMLETPYYDFPSVMQHYLPIYPVRQLLHYEIPTHAFIQKVAAPVTIFQGTRDRVIPYRNAKRLIPFLKPGDEFVTIKGGRHNDLQSFEIVRQKFDSLLSNASIQKK
jgi:uncharacterized protein